MTTIMPTAITGMTMLGTAMAMAKAMERAAACCSASRSR
jgi:hypothetical protein